MRYELKKITTYVWEVYQGKNRINMQFKTATGVLNFVTSKPNNHELYFNDVLVTSELAGKYDNVSFIADKKAVYPEIKDIIMKGSTTTVILDDGRRGTTTLHKDDIQSEELCFIYAYHNARNGNKKRNYRHEYENDDKIIDGIIEQYEYNKKLVEIQEQVIKNLKDVV